MGVNSIRALKLSAIVPKILNKKEAFISREMSYYCTLFSQTFYGLLLSYLTITDVTSYVHHKFPVSFLLYIATKIITVNSNAPIAKKKTLARFACLCLTSLVLSSLRQNNISDILPRWVAAGSDRNMPAQHIATLLGATCCVCLATVLQGVATCWVLAQN